MESFERSRDSSSTQSFLDVARPGGKMFARARCAARQQQPLAELFANTLVITDTRFNAYPVSRLQRSHRRGVRPPQPVYMENGNFGCTPWTALPYTLWLTTIAYVNAPSWRTDAPPPSPFRRRIITTSVPAYRRNQRIFRLNVSSQREDELSRELSLHRGHVFFPFFGFFFFWRF